MHANTNPITETSVTESTESTESTETARRATSSVRRGPGALLVALALTATILLTGAQPAAAASSSPALVTCSESMRTIDITPRLVGDFNGQWAATRFHFARWNGTSWVWHTPTAWNVERVNSANNPAGHAIDQLPTRRFRTSTALPVPGVTPPAGFWVVFTQHTLYTNRGWGPVSGQLTTSYTQVEPSVSHMNDSRTTAAFCRA